MLAFDHEFHAIVPATFTQAVLPMLRSREFVHARPTSGTVTKGSTRGPRPSLAPSTGPDCRHLVAPTVQLENVVGENVALRYRVKTSGPLSVTAIVCSKCAESFPSAVMTLQPSSRTYVS